MKIGYLSSNLEKYKEVAAIIQKHLPQSQVLQITPTEDIEETGQTFEENALLKLQWGLDKGIQNDQGLDVLITEDAGLGIDALEGKEGLRPFPGIHTNRWLTPQLQKNLLGDAPFQNRQKALNAGILKLMDGIKDRSARYICALGIWQKNDPNPKTITGTMELNVSNTETGSNGFGYDPIMCLPNQSQTIAEIDRSLKNQLSHRYQAITKWLESIKIKA